MHSFIPIHWHKKNTFKSQCCCLLSNPKPWPRCQTSPPVTPVPCYLLAPHRYYSRLLFNRMRGKKHPPIVLPVVKGRFQYLSDKVRILGCAHKQIISLLRSYCGRIWNRSSKTTFALCTPCRHMSMYPYLSGIKGVTLSPSAFTELFPSRSEPPSWSSECDK